MVAKRTQRLCGVWGMSPEMPILQGPRLWTLPKATCAVPLCEVPTPCRGRRPHHVQKERIGSWEISGLAVSVA